MEGNDGKKRDFAVGDQLFNLRECMVKDEIVHSLGRAYKDLVILKVQQNEVLVPSIKDCDATHMVASCVEAFFIHQFIPSASVRLTKFLTGIHSANQKPHTIHFWSMLQDYLPKDIVREIQSTHVIRTAIGCCRVWIRLSLNEGTLASYLDTMFQSRAKLERYYGPLALIRDTERRSLVFELIKSITEFRFCLSLLGPMLNAWSNSKALQLVMPDYTPWATRSGDENSRLVMSNNYDNRSRRDYRETRSFTTSATTQSASVATVLRDSQATASSGRISPVSPPRSRSFSSPAGAAHVNTQMEHYSIIEDRLFQEIHNEMLQKFNSSSLTTSTQQQESAQQECASVSPEEASVQPPVIPFQSLVSSNSLLGAASWTDSDYQASHANVVNAIYKNTSSTSLRSSPQSAPESSRSILSSTATEESDTTLESNVAGRIADKNRSSSSLLSQDFGSIEDDEEMSSWEVVEDDMALLVNNGHAQTLLDLFPGRQKMSLRALTSCAGCKHNFKTGVNALRRDLYTQEVYCAACHADEYHSIPWLILDNWDFSPKPVAIATRAVLTQLWSHPNIDVAKCNPQLYNVVPGLARVRQLRRQLQVLWRYLVNCDKRCSEEFRASLPNREYLYESRLTWHLYALADLEEVKNSELERSLRKAAALAQQHVLHCSHCAKSGSMLCDICRDSACPIHLFQVDTYLECLSLNCAAVYHTNCAPAGSPVACRRCHHLREMAPQLNNSDVYYDAIFEDNSK